ncbi:SCO family protein [Thiothrix subterranea]|uniref:SCO family protein n=1 Tax=Thiothrix subterranea TaxID=2735563 RepID=A0AA51MPL8_9GAMM|nr:SCO family protein [Thiothrix subterranea]MDQ5768548.1 SCO family protein [Thiothrix subterranea]WML87569.1 SCO family protein [Thiothrix subterranea]
MLKQIIGVVLAMTLGAGSAWIAAGFFSPDAVVSDAALPLPQGGDFTLQGVNGAVNLRDFRGKTVVLYFGYTACPDICPTSMATLKAALGQLNAAELQQVQGLFVSVDPERDTLAHIQRYVGYFHHSLIGVSGEQAQLQEITRRYNAFYRKVDVPGSAMAYTIDHSAILYVIDKQGQVREQVQHAVPPAELAAAIRRWL